MDPCKEQRHNPRFECSGHAEVHLPEATTCYCAKILNLSLEGCQVELTKPVYIQEDILDLVFSVNGLPFCVRGHIQYIKNETKIGIHFMQLSSRARQQLVDLLKELEEESSRRKAMSNIAS